MNTPPKDKNETSPARSAEENPWIKMANEVLAEKTSEKQEEDETSATTPERKKESSETSNSFVELLQRKNYEQLAIDEDLKPTFKTVMNGIQSYFNANDYSANKDYRQLLNDCLIKDTDEKLSIRYADLANGVGGHYVHYNNSATQYIEINKKINGTMPDAEIAHTLCHEFIHFLAMRGNRDTEFADRDIIGGGFVNEALTESLARQIFPTKDTSYEPQVRMLDFANLMTGQRNNYKLFLAKGKVDAAQRIAHWKNFSEIADCYWAKARKDPMLNHYMSSAEKDDDYIKAQRFLIENTVRPHTIKQFTDYAEAIDKIQSRPAKDDAWTEEYLLKIEESLAGELCGKEAKNQQRRNYIMSVLKEFRSIPDELQKYEGRDVYEFKEGDVTIAVDPQGNVEHHGPVKQQTIAKDADGKVQKIEIITSNNEKYTFSPEGLSKDDFKKRKQNLLLRQKQISDFLSGDVREDLRAYETMPRDAQKLESFIIPIVSPDETKSKFQTIRIATTENGTVSFAGTSYREIGNISNIGTMRLEGFNSGPDHLLYGKPAPQIPNGKVFSCLSESNIQTQAIKEIKQQFIKGSTKEQLDQLFDWFAQTPDYDPEDTETSKEDWYDFAAYKYIKTNYQNLNEDYRNSTEKNIIDNAPKFVVAKVGDKITVASLYGVGTLSYKSQTLYDKSTNAPLNGYQSAPTRSLKYFSSSSL